MTTDIIFVPGLIFANLMSDNGQTLARQPTIKGLASTNKRVINPFLILFYKKNIVNKKLSKFNAHVINNMLLRDEMMSECL